MDKAVSSTFCLPARALMAGCLLAWLGMPALAQVGGFDDRDSRRGAPYYNDTDGYGYRLSDEERVWRDQQRMRRDQWRQQQELTRQDDWRQRQNDEPIGQRALREQAENRRQQGRLLSPGSPTPPVPANPAPGPHGPRHGSRH